MVSNGAILYPNMLVVFYDNCLKAMNTVTNILNLAVVNERACCGDIGVDVQLYSELLTAI